MKMRFIPLAIAALTISACGGSDSSDGVLNDSKYMASSYSATSTDSGDLTGTWIGLTTNAHRQDFFGSLNFASRDIVSIQDDGDGTGVIRFCSGEEDNIEISGNKIVIDSVIYDIVDNNHFGGDFSTSFTSENSMSSRGHFEAVKLSANVVTSIGEIERFSLQRSDLNLALINDSSYSIRCFEESDGVLDYSSLLSEEAAMNSGITQTSRTYIFGENDENEVEVELDEGSLHVSGDVSEEGPYVVNTGNFAHISGTAISGDYHIIAELNEQKSEDDYEFSMSSTVSTLSGDFSVGVLSSVASGTFNINLNALP